MLEEIRGQEQRHLVHLAANILILLATVWEAELISGESLKSLKSEGRGRAAKGRWVHWRTNSQIRGALWRCLRYKCHLSGLHLAWQHPRGTTHICPHCGEGAKTYASPELSAPTLTSGAWLRCFACGWNGARDYAATINIALLGVAFLKQALQSPQSQPDDHPTMTAKGLNSESYSGSGLALRLLVFYAIVVSTVAQNHRPFSTSVFSPPWFGPACQRSCRLPAR
jgi:putative transposase